MHRALLRFVSLAATSLALASLTLAAPVLATGCGSSEEEEEFDFDGEDLQAVIVGTWSGSLTESDGTVRTMDLTLTYAEPGKDPACGNRELGRPEAQPQCITQSSIHLTGEVTIDSGELTAANVTGSYYVEGTELRDGFMEAEISQQMPPPDETKLSFSTNGPLEGAKLTLNLDLGLGKGNESWALTRK